MVRRGGAGRAGRVRVPELTNSAWIMPVQIDQAASAAAASRDNKIEIKLNLRLLLATPAQN